jgi:ADP-heptose:LPS heptosyltransferase
MNKLFFRSNFVRLVFEYANNFLGIFISKNDYKYPKKIIISNIAHMGDFLLSVPAILKIKEKFPNVEIGIVCSSESLEIAREIVKEENIYVYRHWKLNRAKISLFKKYFIYLRDLIYLSRIINSKKFELAIDLYPYYPNSMTLLWLAKVSFRVGFSSSALGNLSSLSYDIEFPLCKHITEYQKNLLRYFFKQCLNFDDDWVVASYLNHWKALQINEFSSEKYCVFQIGAGVSEKRWPSKNWSELINSINDKIIIVGKGVDDFSYYLEIKNYINNKENVINLINKLNFIELVNLVSTANYVVAGDSLITHIAYVLKKPQICLLSDKNDNLMWIPQDIKAIYNPDASKVLDLIKEL